MCNSACLDFIKAHVAAKEIKGKLVLEAGARNVNGSARDWVVAMKPRRYVGTDIEAGPGVDYQCDAGQLVETFGEESFDVLISTELLEHVEDWRAVIHNFKTVLKPGGVLFITTRSKGFPYHAYPGDHWRYEIADMQKLFGDFDTLFLESDPSEPGVFMKAVKPDDFEEVDLSEYELYSIHSETVQGSQNGGTSEQPPEPPPDRPFRDWGIA